MAGRPTGENRRLPVDIHGASGTADLAGLQIRGAARIRGVRRE